jgi:hypothetical protein
MDSPFSESFLHHLRQVQGTALGLGEGWEQPEEGQPFHLGLLRGGLARAGDPDAGILDQYKG